MRNDTSPRTLPGWVYGSEEFLALEKRELFGRHWMAAGHVCEVPEPGDFLALEVGDERVFVVRDADGELRAFHNVCRHRASRVVRGERGNCGRVITCPYHGWTYGLDGRLRGAPAKDTFRGLRFEEIRLPPVALDAWHGFLFVRIAGDGPSLGEAFAPFEAEASRYPLERLELRGSRVREVVPVNWKCLIDNDNEGYHVPQGHPGLQRLYGATYRDQTFPHGAMRSSGEITETPSPAWSERAYQGLLARMDHLPVDLRRRWLYYGLFPSFSMGIYPDSVDFFSVQPLDAGHTLVVSHNYAFPAESREMRAAQYLNGRINDQVWREDLDLVLGMAPGLRSSSFNGGPISDLEPCLADFHATIRALLPVANREHRPDGDLAAINANCGDSAHNSPSR